MNNGGWSRIALHGLVWALAACCPLVAASLTDAATGADSAGIETRNEIPADLSIVYSTGSTHAEWGGSTYEISADGRVAHTKAQGPRGAQSAQTKYYRLTEKELSLIVETIRKNHFFGLDQHYYHPHIRDGWSSRLLVTMDRKTHSVSVMNVRQQEFAAIAHLISGILAKKKPSKSR